MYTSIIVTHQARLRCFLKSYLDNTVHRFQNGAVLKMTLDKSGTEIELIYNGEIDEKKPGYTYYVTPDSKLPYGAVYKVQTFPKINIKNAAWPTSKYQDRYVFYLIRHGQALHNVASGLKKKLGSVLGDKDTALTAVGIQQAINSGKSMSGVIHKIDYIFSSDLRRTRQTLVKFLEGLRVQVTGEIIVLPCAHELSYVKGKSCDGNQGPTAAENKMTCAPNHVYIDNHYKLETAECLGTNPRVDYYRDEMGNKVGHQTMMYDRRTDWDYYTNFYNGTRSNPSQGKRHCRNTDFVSEAISYIKGQEKIARETEDRNKRMSKYQK